jgi:hypothetical protein
MVMTRAVGVLTLAVLAWAVPARCGAADAYAVKVADSTPVPPETPEVIAKLLTDRCVQLVNDKGDLLAELWFRKGAPARATEAQIQNGLTYRELPETTLLGVVRLSVPLGDYRKQKVMPGVYTLRLAIQPVTDDHVGTAPFPEFCLLSPAAEDKDPATMAAKSLQEMSIKSTGKHPAVLLLVPGKGATAEPKLVTKGSGHWVLLFLLEVKVGEKSATLPVGLTLLGASSAA